MDRPEDSKEAEDEEEEAVESERRRTGIGMGALVVGFCSRRDEKELRQFPAE